VSSWNVMAHGDAREGKWRGDWRMKWVASTLHTTSERVVSSITNADAHTSAASSRLNWLHRRFKWTRPFRRKINSGFCACAITFQTQSTWLSSLIRKTLAAKHMPLTFFWSSVNHTLRQITRRNRLRIPNWLCSNYRIYLNIRRPNPPAASRSSIFMKRPM